MTNKGLCKFKDSVIKPWGYDGCASTLSLIKGSLRGSHIEPWRECTGGEEWKRVDGANGIELSRQPDEEELARLGISQDLELAPNTINAKDKERFLDYFAEHYQQFLSISSVIGETP